MAAKSGGDEFTLPSLMEGNPVATIVIDAHHRVVHWNQACAMLTGVAASDMIGTRGQWRAFYAEPRPILADLIVDRALDDAIGKYYAGKFRRSPLIEGAFEAEDFFPAFGHEGAWLYFTAAPLHNVCGETIGAIETLQDVTRRRRAEEALKLSEERYRQLSLTDSLTGLFNARQLHARLHDELERANRYRHPLSMLMIDCDDFKQINDTFGHLEGDKVLQALARAIESSLRVPDSAYRYGGEEFVILLPETGGDAARALSERLRLGFAATEIVSAAGELMKCTISVGIAESLPGETDASLMRRADCANYAAKHQGKNCSVMASYFTSPGESLLP